MKAETTLEQVREMHVGGRIVPATLTGVGRCSATPAARGTGHRRRRVKIAGRREKVKNEEKVKDEEKVTTGSLEEVHQHRGCRVRYVTVEKRCGGLTRVLGPVQGRKVTGRPVCSIGGGTSRS